MRTVWPVYNARFANRAVGLSADQAEALASSLLSLHHVSGVRRTSEASRLTAAIVQVDASYTGAAKSCE